MEDVKFKFEEYPIGRRADYSLTLDEAICGYGTISADICEPDVTIINYKEEIEKLEGQVATLIRAVTNLIADNEMLKQDNIKKTVDICDLESKYTALMDMVNTKLDKA